jgi:hypothetical protein
MATRSKRYTGIPSQRPYWSGMKVILILASLMALAPMVRADEVVVRHDNDRNVVVHEHHRHHYYRHHDVVVVHPN